MPTRRTKKKLKHYSLFGVKTLCGLQAAKGEETLTAQVNCKDCLEEAIQQHYQLALFANAILKGKRQ